MTSTDPTQFDPESTGTFRVGQLSELSEPLVQNDFAGQPVIRPVQPTPPACGWNPVTATTDCDWDRNCPVHGQAVRPQPSQSYVSLVYVGTDGVSRRVDGDHNLISHHDSTDADHRERLILKALLMHALAMLNGEDVS